MGSVPDSIPKVTTNTHYQAQIFFGYIGIHGSLVRIFIEFLSRIVRSTIDRCYFLARLAQN